jgi:hypothetical protein
MQIRTPIQIPAPHLRCTVNVRVIPIAETRCSAASNVGLAIVVKTEAFLAGQWVCIVSRVLNVNQGLTLSQATAMFVVGRRAMVVVLTTTLAKKGTDHTAWYTVTRIR